VPEKNKNRERTRFADHSQIFTAYFSDKFIDKSENKIKIKKNHYKFFDFKILGFAIFEQKDKFFKKSLKILRINFFQIGKKRFDRNYLYFKKTRKNLDIGIPEYCISVLPIS
jgi:hypothetical protein